jgi:hypothetical protein
MASSRVICNRISEERSTSSKGHRTALRTCSRRDDNPYASVKMAAPDRTSDVAAFRRFLDDKVNLAHAVALPERMFGRREDDSRSGRRREARLHVWQACRMPRRAHIQIDGVPLHIVQEAPCPSSGVPTGVDEPAGRIEWVWDPAGYRRG